MLAEDAGGRWKLTPIHELGKLLTCPGSSATDRGRYTCRHTPGHTHADNQCRVKLSWGPFFWKHRKNMFFKRAGFRASGFRLLSCSVFIDVAYLVEAVDCACDILHDFCAQKM